MSPPWRYGLRLLGPCNFVWYVCNSGISPIRQPTSPKINKIGFGHGYARTGERHVYKNTAVIYAQKFTMHGVVSFSIEPVLSGISFFKLLL